MKAVRVHEFGGPEVLKYEKNAPIPPIGSEDVLIRVKAIGVNPVETYIRSGQYSSRLPKLPFVLGGDSTGIVEDVRTGGVVIIRVIMYSHFVLPIVGLMLSISLFLSSLFNLFQMF